MTNYKVLPFTEENLKMEGAEVWHQQRQVKETIRYKFSDGSWLIVFSDEHYGRYGQSSNLHYLQIRIPVKQYTVAEVWEDYNDGIRLKWDEMEKSANKSLIAFARRIAELAKADQIKLD